MWKEMILVVEMWCHEKSSDLDSEPAALLLSSVKAAFHQQLLRSLQGQGRELPWKLKALLTIGKE